MQGDAPEPGPDAAGEPAVPPVAPAGVDLARAMLAQAKADARAKGNQTRSPQRRGRDLTRSGAHPDERDPQPLGRSATRLAAEHGWEDHLAVGAVMGRWPEIVGTDLAAHCEPVGWEDGVLTIRADSTAWATQVRLLTPQLLRRLGQELGADTVSRVDVRGPGSPTWTKGPRSVKGRGPRDTYG